MIRMCTLVDTPSRELAVAQATPLRPLEEANETSQLRELPRVVFHCNASFHPLFWLIALVPGSSLWMVWFFADDGVICGRGAFVATTVVFWITCFVILGFFCVLPHKYEVMSDASLNIVTFVMKTWTFRDACAVYDHQSYCSPKRQVLRLASDFDNCVLVKRKNGWDVLLSPKDPGGFVEEFWNVLSKQDGDLHCLEEPPTSKRCCPPQMLP